MWAKSSWYLGQRKRTRAGLGDAWDPGREKLGSHLHGPPDPLNFVFCHNALLSLSPRSPW